MDSWQLIGTLSPGPQKKFFEPLTAGQQFRLVIDPAPETDCYLIFEGWQEGRKAGQVIKSIIPEQVFNWPSTSQRLISVRVGRPIKSASPWPDLTIALLQWEAPPQQAQKSWQRGKV